jgi:hypothetical protein
MPSGLITVRPIAFWNGLTRISTVSELAGFTHPAEGIGQCSMGTRRAGIYVDRFLKITHGGPFLLPH